MFLVQLAGSLSFSHSSVHFYSECWIRPTPYLEFGVAGVVSFSSRLVAGMRAFEAKEKEPLFSDPLAELLAGRRGMEAAKTTMKVRHFHCRAPQNSTKA